MRDHDELEAVQISINGRLHWRYGDGTVLPVISGGDGPDDTNDGDVTDESESDAASESESESDTDADTEDTDNEDEAASADLPNVDLTADEDALREQHAALEELYQERRHADDLSPADVELLTEIRNRQRAIADELTRRVQEAQQTEEQLNQLDEETPSLPEPARVAAQDIVRNRRRQSRGDQRGTQENQRPRVAMVGGPAQDRVEPGTAIEMEDIAIAAERRMRSRATGQAILASLPAYDLPREDVLDVEHGARVNDRLIRESNEEWEARRAGHPPARTAAICDPLDPIREVPDCASAASPVASAFPSRAMGRGGFQFTPAITLAELEDGVSLWSETTQGNVDPDDSATWKPCLPIECPEVSSVRAEAVSACFTFDNTTEMSNPERVNNIMTEIAKLRTRFKEGRLLAIIDAAAVKPPNYTPVNGVLPGVLESVVIALHQVRWANRLENEPFTLFVESSLIAGIVADMANRAFGDVCTQAEAFACLSSTLSDYGVTPVQVLDSASGVNPYAAITGGIALPETTGLRLLPTRDAIYADTGEVNVGITRDANLLRQNRAQWFSEEYFLLAQHGCNPWLSWNLALCPNGARTGWNEPEPCAITS